MINMEAKIIRDTVSNKKPLTNQQAKALLEEMRTTQQCLNDAWELGDKFVRFIQANNLREEWEAFESDAKD